MADSSRPYQVSVSDAALDDLRARLALTRFPDELDEAGWDYGVPLADIKRLVAHWQKGFDWRNIEREINALPQFTQDIEVSGFGTLNIHYVHAKSKVNNAIPLLFVHGWPGSFLEVQKILPSLTESSTEHPSFHVVTFSLPGFGFSEAPRQRGFKSVQYAEIGNKLMLSLGYSEYVTQGGDWGYRITRQMAYTYGGKSVKAWHTNYPKGAPPTFTSGPLRWLSYMLTPYTPAEKAGLERTAWAAKWTKGYSAEQTTRPQTLGYALTDSPVGLLAWIYEKMVEWTDAYPWTDDEALTWASIYWFSRAGPAATLRIYYEVTNGGENGDTMDVPNAPQGVSYFPREINIPPRSWVHASGARVVFEEAHARGGHFAAHEVPELLVADLKKMFGKGGPTYGVVTGKDGYETL